MYTKEQLEKLETGELSSIASQLGLKTDSKSQTDIIYDILDKQAEVGSTQVVEKKAKKAPARKTVKKTAEKTAEEAKNEPEQTGENKVEETVKAKKPSGRKAQAKTSSTEEIKTVQDPEDKEKSKKGTKKTSKPKEPSEKVEEKMENVKEPEAEQPKDVETKQDKEPAIIPTADDFIPIEDIPTVQSGKVMQPSEFLSRFDETLEEKKTVQQEKKSAPQEQKPNKPAFDFSGLVTASGVLEVMNEGYGFLRSSDYNYLNSPDDIYVSQQQIKNLGLKTGDVVTGSIRPPRDNEKFFPLVKATSINGLSPETIRDRVPFEHLVPLFPDEKFTLCKGDGRDDISARIVDLFSPIGKGQRGLIVAQPKTGKTILMKNIANAIAMNHPEAYLMVLLIDERPEEVTDMARTVNAEVIASTFDEPAERHVKIATIVLEKAKRMVECGHDVVIFLDSITRLARAYNTVSPASGKILSGGVDANALQRPKRFFGAARNIENGGSLTIIATALTDTGSKMDDVIFEEFKGTGNMELQLDRNLANKRIFPAVNTLASSTRRDDLLHDPATRERMILLRKVLSDMTPVETMNRIKDLMDKTKNNEEFFLMTNS